MPAGLFNAQGRMRKFAALQHALRAASREERIFPTRLLLLLQIFSASALCWCISPEAFECPAKSVGGIVSAGTGNIYNSTIG